MNTNLKSTSHINQKIHSFTLEFKLSAIEHSEKHDIRVSARKFNTDVKSEWRKVKEATIEKMQCVAKKVRWRT